MRLPHHPALPFVGVALLAYLCGDVACAVMERQWQRSAAAGPLVGSVAFDEQLWKITHKPELGAILTANQSPREFPEPAAHVALPVFVGTLESGPRRLALLQWEADLEVVEPGETCRGLELLRVDPSQVELRKGQRFISLRRGASASSEVAAPGPELFRTRRQLREVLDRRSEWVGEVRLNPVTRDGQIVAARIDYRGDRNPFPHLGLHSGDVIYALNQVPCRGMENAEDLFRELINSPVLHFDVERDGQRRPVHLELEP